MSKAGESAPLVLSPGAATVLKRRIAHTDEFRQAPLVPLSTVIDTLVEPRQTAYLAHRASLGSDGHPWRARHRRWTEAFRVGSPNCRTDTLNGLCQ